MKKAQLTGRVYSLGKTNSPPYGWVLNFEGDDKRSITCLPYFLTYDEAKQDAQRTISTLRKGLRIKVEWECGCFGKGGGLFK